MDQAQVRSEVGELELVANGSKPYCDGGQPSDTDRTWAQLSVAPVGEPKLVKGILGSR